MRKLLVGMRVGWSRGQGESIFEDAQLILQSSG